MNEFRTIKKFKSLNLTYVESWFFSPNFANIDFSYIIYLLSNFNMHTTKKWARVLLLLLIKPFISYINRKRPNSIFLENKKNPAQLGYVIFLIVFYYIFIMHFDFFINCQKDLSKIFHLLDRKNPWENMLLTRVF